MCQTLLYNVPASPDQAIYKLGINHFQTKESEAKKD